MNNKIGIECYHYFEDKNMNLTTFTTGDANYILLGECQADGHDGFIEPAEDEIEALKTGKLFYLISQVQFMNDKNYNFDEKAIQLKTPIVSFNDGKLQWKYSEVKDYSHFRQDSFNLPCKITYGVYV